MGNHFVLPKGLVVTHLRFSPQEYQAISHLCRPLDLHRYPWHALKRLLVYSLAELGQRIAQMGREEFKILHDHFRESQRLEGQHELSPEELSVVAQAGGPLLFNARFVRPLKRALVQRPDLATKLERMSHTQFEMLCQQVR
jgi:hypothetical protein